MPKKISAWQCSFCSRYRITKSAIARHEQICFENPDRKILDGQLAVFSTIPRELLTTDSYGVPRSDWEEPIWNPSEELRNKYKWWPFDKDGSLGLGYVFMDGKWRKIKGYQPPHFAPGYSWKDEVIPEEIEVEV